MNEKRIEVELRKIGDRTYAAGGIVLESNGKGEPTGLFSLYLEDMGSQASAIKDVAILAYDLADNPDHVIFAGRNRYFSNFDFIQRLRNTVRRQRTGVTVGAVYSRHCRDDAEILMMDAAYRKTSIFEKLN